MAAFDAICSAQKDRRLGASHLTLPYPTLPYLRKVSMSLQLGEAEKARHYVSKVKTSGERAMLANSWLDRRRAAVCSLFLSACSV